MAPKIESDILLELAGELNNLSENIQNIRCVIEDLSIAAQRAKEQKQ